MEFKNFGWKLNDMTLKVTDENYPKRDVEGRRICNCGSYFTFFPLNLLQIFISELNLFTASHFIATALCSLSFKCHSFLKAHSRSLSYANCIAIDCKILRKQQEFRIALEGKKDRLKINLVEVMLGARHCILGKMCSSQLFASLTLNSCNSCWDCEASKRDLCASDYLINDSN